MQSSPNTDKTFGIASAEKFRDVRERSKKQEIERKMRRDRKQEFQPRFNIRICHGEPKINIINMFKLLTLNILEDVKEFSIIMALF